MTFEQIFSQMADKAMAKRRGITVTVRTADKPPAVLGRPKSNHWPRIVEVMGNEWMTSKTIATRVRLTTPQVVTQLVKVPSHRAMLEIRGNTRIGFEWRMKSRELGPGRGGV